MSVGKEEEDGEEGEDGEGEDGEGEDGEGEEEGEEEEEGEGEGEEDGAKGETMSGERIPFHVFSRGRRSTSFHDPTRLSVFCSPFASPLPGLLPNPSFPPANSN